MRSNSLQPQIATTLSSAYARWIRMAGIDAARFAASDQTIKPRCQLGPAVARKHMTHQRSVFQIVLKREKQRQQGCSHCTMLKIEARPADIESRRVQSFSTGRSLPSHSVPAKGRARAVIIARTSWRRCSVNSSLCSGSYPSSLRFAPWREPLRPSRARG